MKIDPVKLYQQVGTQQVGTNEGKRGVSDRAAGEKFATLLAGTEQAKAATQPKPVSPTLAIERMVVVEAVGDALERRKRGHKRGKHLLERLDRIRHGLLSGQLSQAQIEELIAALAVEKSTIDDPRLAELLDEIDLRAQVELAKYHTRSNL